MMSDLVRYPRERTRAGKSMLRMKSEFERGSVIRVPLASVSVLVVREYQAGLWALKSPMMNDVFITEVKKKVKVRCEIRDTTGYRGDVTIINVDGGIVDGGCYDEFISYGVGGKN